jgi:HSP20 family protein
MPLCCSGWPMIVRSSGVRPRSPSTLPSEVADFGDEIRRIFLDIGRTFGPDSLVGQCAPPIDVYERDGTIEIVADLPGVDPAAVRVIARGDAILIVGEKSARRTRSASSFHLVERDFGRFARAVRLGYPCDAANARARFTNGELHISVPKIAERRGRTIPIAFEDSTPA